MINKSGEAEEISLREEKDGCDLLQQLMYVRRSSTSKGTSAFERRELQQLATLARASLVKTILYQTKPLRGNPKVSGCFGGIRLSRLFAKSIWNRAAMLCMGSGEAPIPHILVGKSEGEAIARR